MNRRAAHLLSGILGALVLFCGCKNPNAKLSVSKITGDIPQGSPVISTIPPVNLLTDPGFESGVSGFAAGQVTTAVNTTTNSIIGTQSLQIDIAGYGDSVWWTYDLLGKATSFTVGGKVRSDLASSSTINYCAYVVYDDNTSDSACVQIGGSVGDKGAISKILLLPDKVLTSVRIRVEQVGSAPIRLIVDDASAILTGFVSTAPSTGGGGGGGSGGSGGDPNDVPPGPGTPYPGYTYTTPTTRPFIQMNDFYTANNTSAAFIRLRDQADNAAAITAAQPPGVTYTQLTNALDYGYSCTDSVIMFKFTNDPKYIQQAIRMVDIFVQEELVEINAGRRPEIAADSYLEVGNFLEQLALAYDYGFDRLTTQQRTSWEVYANQVLQNLWYPAAATWGGVAYPWSGWSITDPGNNYFYSFLKATQLWSWATQNNTWITFLQQRKYTLLVPFFSILTGGGSREGTGCGTGMGSMFENYRYWRASTGENLSALSTHSRDTIDYWLHATVPTLDYYASIGDQSRSSMPRMFDYQRRLVLEGVALNQNTDQAKRGVWWLNRARLTDGGSGSVIGRMRYNFNFRFDLLAPATAEQAPTALVYDASGAGAMFARSDWTTTASWMSTVVGTYDQSHAHQDQGSFAFYKGTWLAVTSNIYSHSGLNQDVGAHNVIRFSKGTTVIPQNFSTSTKTYADSVGILDIHQNLTQAYSAHTADVQNWTRDFTYDRNLHRLTVHDLCTITPGVSAVWQLHVPVQPMPQGDGSIIAGSLRIRPIIPAAPTITLVDMNALDSSEFNGGYRIELSAGSQCEFNVELSAQ